MWPAQFRHFSKAGQPFRVAAHYIASQHQDDLGSGKLAPGALYSRKLVKSPGFIYGALRVRRYGASP